MAVEGVTKGAGVGTRTTLNILDMKRPTNQNQIW